MNTCFQKNQTTAYMVMTGNVAISTLVVCEEQLPAFKNLFEY